MVHNLSLQDIKGRLADHILKKSKILGDSIIYDVKISKKEAKESRFWLNLSSPTKNYEHNKIELMCECEELQKIFGAIIRNSSVMNLLFGIYLGFRV